MSRSKKKFLLFTSVFLLVVAIIANPIKVLFANYNAIDLLGHVNGGGAPIFSNGSINNAAGSGFPNNQGFEWPQGIDLDAVHHRLFVSDTLNNRIMVFDLDTSNNISDRTADHVLGQADFVSGAGNRGGAIAANTLSGPRGLVYDSVANKLYASDAGNNRVLVYDVATIVDGEAAVGVFGQGDFISGSSNRGNVASDADTLDNPAGLTLDTTRGWLFVADQTNHRVLIFDYQTPTPAALYVLGKPDFVTAGNLTSQSRMNQPYDVEYDPSQQRLFVAEKQSRRVTIFDVRNPASAPITLCPLIYAGTTTGIANGMVASCEIGQNTFNSNNSGTNDHQFLLVYGVSYDAANNLLYVLDQASRVLIFDVSTISAYPNETAIAVFGQSDFTSLGTSSAAGGLSRAQAIVFNPLNRNFFIADTENNRVTNYKFITINTSTLPDGTVGLNYNQAITTADSQGSVSLELAAGSSPLPPGLSFSGTNIVGIPTYDGPYPHTYSNIIIRAVDNTSDAGIFYSDPVTYSITINLLPAGVTVTPISGNTTEFGGSATFTVVLDSPTLPGQDVTINLSSSDATEGLVTSPTTLTFTNANWNVPQTVTVTGQDDFIADGPVIYSAVTSNTTSAYSEYNNRTVADVSITNTDNDTAGVTVDVTSLAHTTEALATTTFTIRLNTQPTANVTIPLTSDDLSEGTVSPASLTFTSVDWSTPKVVTVTGVNDDLDDGDITYHILTGTPVISAGTDTVYGGMTASDISDVTVINDDDGDTAGVSVSAISGNTTEAGGTATFTVVLTSEPLGDVTIDLMSSDTTEGTVVPTTLTFTNLDWDIPQTVTVTGVNDPADDGDIVYSIITLDATSVSDPQYDGMVVSDVSVTNIDDDAGGGGGVLIIESFDLAILAQPTATSVNAQFIVSSAGGGATTQWDMVYSTNAADIATLPHVPWVPQLNGITIPRGATYMYVKYFDRNNPNHTSQIISRPLALFDDPNDPDDDNNTSGECLPYLTTYLERGANNDPTQVELLQNFLHDEEGMSYVYTTGIFDDATYRGVVAFQERYHDEILSPWFNAHGTGRVFVTTKKKINELHCAHSSKTLKECKYFDNNKYAQINDSANDPAEVAKIQTFLRHEMFLTSDSSTSGMFDILLDQAVREFQATYHRDVADPWGSKDKERSGWWYITTQAKANEIYCSKYPNGFAN